MKQDETTEKINVERDKGIDEKITFYFFIFPFSME